MKKSTAVAIVKEKLRVAIICSEEKAPNKFLDGFSKGYIQALRNVLRDLEGKYE